VKRQRRLKRLPRRANYSSTAYKEIDMTTNELVELGEVSEETKEPGPFKDDNEVEIHGTWTM
jgi:hypothetical protein